MTHLLELIADIGVARYLCMGAVILTGALLQGVSGLGFAMFSAPVAGLFFPELAPGPLLLLAGALSVLTVRREVRHIVWPVVNSALVGRVAGTLAAGYVIAWFSPRWLSVAFALMILAGVGLNLAGRQFAASLPNMAVAGAASGLMGTITSSGSSPFALVMQSLTPAQMRASLGCIFAIGAAVSLAVLVMVGSFTASRFILGVSLAPFMVGGFLLSSRMTHLIDARRMRGMLLAFAAIGSIAILIRA
jgi:uncharacterized membrane protein YfcA